MILYVITPIGPGPAVPPSRVGRIHMLFVTCMTRRRDLSADFLDRIFIFQSIVPNHQPHAPLAWVMYNNKGKDNEKNL